MTPTVNVLIIHPLSDRHLDTITSQVPQAKITISDLNNAIDYIAEADVIVTMGLTDLQPLFAQAVRLKWIHAITAGVEKLIFPESQQSNVIITNSRGIHAIPISEHVLLLMLAFTRRLPLLFKQQAAKQWQRVFPAELHDKTVGIIGLGSIGREIAKKSKSMGMHVLATKRELSEEIFINKIYPADSLLEMLPECDFVVVALPLTPQTQGMITLEHFTIMKDSAYLINIARGDIINQADLIQALDQGLIAGAGLDVFEHEPLPTDNPLWSMPNVIISPHVAGSSPYYIERAVKLFANNLASFVNGGEMLNVVDKIKGY